MKRVFLTSAAAAVLALGVAAANAQQRQDMQDRGSPAATQQSAPGSAGAGRQERPRAQSREGTRAQPGDRARTRSPSTTGAATRESGQQSAEEPVSRSRQPSSAATQRDSGRAARGENARDRNRNASDERANRSSQTSRSERNERNATRGSDRGRNAQERSARERSAQERSARERSAQERSSQRSRERSAREERSRSRSSRETTGAAASEERATERTRSRRDERATERTPSIREDRRSSEVEGRSTARGAATLSGEQRTRVTERFTARLDDLNVRSIPRSRVSVRIGASIPRSIRLYDVPEDVIAIYPRFRGDRFVLVEDEIVVVEPGSRRIVAVLPREGGSRYSARETTGRAVSGERGRLRLTADERREIRTVVLRDPECRYEARLDFTFGIPLPRSVQVCEFPEAVVSEVPEIERYRFVVKGDDIVVVDPDEYRVVDVIR